jgi:spermidine synthase
MLRILKSALSYFVVIPEHRFDSEYSGRMDIRWENGRLSLNSPEANYSFNALHKVFQSAFSFLELGHLGSRPILNLGMGAGSTISILRRQYGLKNRIDSVELDSPIISVAKNYFKVNEYPDHRIHHADAITFLEGNKDQFGLIIVDLFIDKHVSEKFISKGFYDLIDSHLSNEGQVMFNFMGRDSHPFLPLIPNHYKSKVIKKGENKVLIYLKTDKS